MNDVSFRVLPLTVDDALDMVREIAGYQVIKGYRGMASVREDVIVDLLLRANAMGLDLRERA